MKISTFLLLGFITSLCSCTAHDKAASTNKTASEFQVRIYKNDTVPSSPNNTGFGYDILKQGAVYIHQPIIPAVQGEAGFSSEAKAQQAAAFVLNKIEHNIIPPSVSAAELDSLGVLD